MKMDMGNIATPSISQADLARLPPEIRAKIPQFNGKQMSMDYEHCLTEQDMVPQQQKAHEHRSEEHTSELQSLMRISYAVFCLKKKKNRTNAKKQKYTREQ